MKAQQLPKSRVYLASAITVGMLLAAGYGTHRYLNSKATPATLDGLSEEQLFERANTLYKEGNLQGALEAYMKVLSTNTTHAAAHFNVALVLEKMGNTTLALKEYQTVLTLEPNNAKAYLQLGNIMQKNNRKAQALTFFKKAITCEPDSLNVRFTAATLSAEQKTADGYALAVQQLALLVQARPDDAMLQQRLDRVKAEQSRLA